MATAGQLAGCRLLCRELDSLWMDGGGGEGGGAGRSGKPVAAKGSSTSRGGTVAAVWNQKQPSLLT
jgi:hypothetical protein